MSANNVLLYLRPKRMSTILGFTIPLVIIGLLILASTPKPSSAEDATEFTASLLDGATIRLSDYRGQVVMLNFWATWCPPCRREMPMLQTVADRYQEFVILAVNNGESPEQIQPFVDQLGLRFPIVLDETGQLQRMFRVMGYPTSIFIDREGRIFATHLGELNSEQLADYIETGLAG